MPEVQYHQCSWRAVSPAFASEARLQDQINKPRKQKIKMGLHTATKARKYKISAYQSQPFKGRLRDKRKLKKIMKQTAYLKIFCQ